MKKKIKEIIKIHDDLLGKISLLSLIFFVNALLLLFFNEDIKCCFEIPVIATFKMFGIDKYVFDLWKIFIPTLLKIILSIWFLLTIIYICLYFKISYKKIFYLK